MSEPIQFEAPDPEEFSEMLEGYDVTSLIAVGGMGAVYKAVQVSLDRDVAIKLLPREFGTTEFREKFQDEAKAMAKLNHVNLIGIYDFGEADGMPYIVMEMVAGKSLYYSSYGKMIEQEAALELVIGICRGLAHAHEAGIIHRDIKPANILLDPNAKPKIGDFGLASSVGDEEDADGMIYGTPGYAAPEVVSNPETVGVPSDIFAVGVILYELLTGKMPEQPASPPSKVSKCDMRLDPIFRKATRRNPEARYQDAGELADDLEQILKRLQNGGGLKTVKTGVRRTVKTATPVKRRLTTVSTGDQGGAARPKLVPLPPKGDGEESAPRPVTPAVASASEGGEAPAQVAPVSTSTKGGAWPIIRNLVIIAALIPAVIFVWGIYQDKMEKDAAQQAEEDKRKRQEQMEWDAKQRISEEKNRELIEKQKAEAARRAAANLEQEKKEAIEAAKSPMELLAELKGQLSKGIRNDFPRGSVDRPYDVLFFVNEPMTWSGAAKFAMEHGGHLVAPVNRGDLDVLTSRMGDEYESIWLGAGTQGRDGWAWVNGRKWKYDDLGTSLGNCAVLRQTGVLRAANGAEKRPFVIQWMKDGSNPGSMEEQLDRLVGTLDTPTPNWPPTSIAFKNRVYLMIYEELSWPDAELAAGAVDGHLAVASDGLEGRFINDYLEEALKPGESVWLGGRLEGGEWGWASGEKMVKPLWKPGSPDGGPNESAIRFLRGEGEDLGWDDVSPRKGGAVGYLIEWSKDRERRVEESGQPGAKKMTKADLEKMRSIAKRSVAKQEKTVTTGLKLTREQFLSSAKTWFRQQSSTNQDRWRGEMNRLAEMVPESGDFGNGLSVDGYPVEVGRLHDRILRKQKEVRTKYETGLEKMRQRYLARLVKMKKDLAIRPNAELSAMVDEDLAGVGQDWESFRNYFR